MEKQTERERIPFTDHLIKQTIMILQNKAIQLRQG